MFTQRNNKAKCFQDCIVEETKTETWMAWGFRWDGGFVEWGWYSFCFRVGVCRWRQQGEGRAVIFGGEKTSNLSPCPVPLVSQTRCKMWGQCGETDAYAARIWTDGFKGKQLEGHKPTFLPSNPQNQNPPTHLHRDNLWYQYSCMSLNEAVNVEFSYYRAGQKSIHRKMK